MQAHFEYSDLEGPMLSRATCNQWIINQSVEIFLKKGTSEYPIGRMIYKTPEYPMLKATPSSLFFRDPGANVLYYSIEGIKPNSAFIALFIRRDYSPVSLINP